MSTIANRVYTQEDIILNNEERDITVTLRPLPIARLREFMVEWDKMEAVNEKAEKDADSVTEEEIFEVYIRCCAVALRKQLQTEVEEIFDDKGEFTKEYITLIEEFCELPSIVKILDICGGVRLENPKLQEALDAILAETPVEVGTN